MRIADAGWFGLLALAILPWLWSRRRPRLAWPSLDGFGPKSSRWAALARAIPWLLQGSALACLSVAMARPREPRGQIRVAGRGVAIVAVIDRSSSMKTVDFPTERGPTSRLEAAKATLARFILARADDLVGLVPFANYSDPTAPTLEQRFLLETVRAIRPAGAVDDGTNLGDAIIVGMDLLRKAPPRRKVLVLLTDGRNAPAVPKPFSPVEAARIARDLKVTLHTIAVGRVAQEVPPDQPNKETPPSEVDGPDLALLRQLADVGGGRAFVATDADTLDQVFAEIDKLEKSPVVGTVRTLYRERFAPWAVSALALLAVGLAMRSGRFRRLP